MNGAVWVILALPAMLPAVRGQSCELPSGSIIRATADSRVRLSSLRPGAVLSGTINRPVYHDAHRLIPAGARVDLIVGRVNKQRGPARGWRSVLSYGRHLFIPRGPRPDYTVSLRQARLRVPGEAEIPASMSLVGSHEPVRLVKKGERPRAAGRRSTLVLRVDEDASLPQGMCRSVAEPIQSAGKAGLAPGSTARLTLLSPLTASRTAEGEVVRASLIEPLVMDGRTVVPDGALFEARVVRRAGPRSFGRSGSIGLTFFRMSLPGGQACNVSASVAGIDADRGAALELGKEGAIQAQKPRNTTQLLRLGASYALGKVVDDLFEEGVKAALGAAVSGSAATAARYIGIGTGVLFFALQQGQDVHLARYTEIDVSFNRPVSLDTRTLHCEENAAGTDSSRSADR